MALSFSDRGILQRQVRPLFSAALVAEHRAHPFGPHSPPLAELLQFLRRNPDPELPRYVVLRSGIPPCWQVGVLRRESASLFAPVDGVHHATRGSAEHAVFLKRLSDYRIGAHEETDRPSAAVELGARVREAGEPTLMGYLDRLCAAPGDSVALHVSVDAPTWTAELVRLWSAELAPEGQALREQLVTAAGSIERDGIVQRTAVGSYVAVERAPGAFDSGAAWSLRVFVMPALPGHGVQGLISQRGESPLSGWSLRLGGRGTVSLWLGTDEGACVLELEQPLVRGCWYLVAASIDPRHLRVQLACRPAGTRAANRVWFGRGVEQRRRFTLAATPRPAYGRPLLLASGWLQEDVQPMEAFDGRLELPLIVGRAAELDELLEGEDEVPSVALSRLGAAAAWDFAEGIGPEGFRRPSLVRDIGPRGCHGRCINHPLRAVISHGWDSRETDFRHAPTQYAAAHFHRDDITDCRWKSQASFGVPAGTPSGVYAIRLRSSGPRGEQVDRVPFIVRPSPSQPRAPLLLVLPTNSYVAYANDHVAVDSPRLETMIRRVPQFDEFDRFRHRHRELGASLYEAHPDGSGICYASGRRPLLTMRPQVETFNGRAWQFTADLQLIDWLDRTGRRCDIIADLDVHREGAGLLGRYPCVMTGTHPEYATRRMIDAFGDYLDGGGRLIYMGGNGLYWVTGYDAEDEQVIEIRRWGGSQAWQACPGEYHLSFTGEPGGLWRSRGLAPQKMVGVGFVASGMQGAGADYLRTADADPRAAWVMAGVERNVFGANGTSGPAAGIEVDAVDPELGTPAQAILIASSRGRHNDDMLEARENHGMTLAAPGGARNARVGSDMVLVVCGGGGGVFSTGSIAWAGALAHDPDVGRILTNVIDRFCSGGALLD